MANLSKVRWDIILGKRLVARNVYADDGLNYFVEMEYLTSDETIVLFTLGFNLHEATKKEAKNFGCFTLEFKSGVISLKLMMELSAELRWHLQKFDMLSKIV